MVIQQGGEKQISAETVRYIQKVLIFASGVLKCFFSYSSEIKCYCSKTEGQVPSQLHKSTVLRRARGKCKTVSLITPLSSLRGPESHLPFPKPDFPAQCCDELKISVTLIFLFFFWLTKLLSPCEWKESYLVLHHERYAVQSATFSLAEVDWEKYFDRPERHKSLHNWNFAVDWITGVRPNTALISLWLFVGLQGSSAWPT